MAERILRAKELTEKLSVSMSALYEWVNRADFPRPRQIGPRAVGWLESDIDSYIKSLPVTEPQPRRARRRAA